MINLIKEMGLISLFLFWGLFSALFLCSGLTLIIALNILGVPLLLMGILLLALMGIFAER